MKLLSKVAPKIEEDGVSIQMPRVTKMMQANLIDLSLKADDIVSKIALIDYVCNNCIESITIEGDKYDPAELAESADISDDETLMVLMKVASMVVGAAFLSEDDVKK